MCNFNKKKKKVLKLQILTFILLKEAGLKHKWKWA